VKAIVVGTGFGARVHVPALQLAGIEVAALVGRDPDKTARRAARVGAETACTDLRQALAIAGTEIVVIASPPDTHAPLALEAIRAGRHVLVEKPFTLDAAQARELETEAASAGLTALVGHEFRFAPERIAVSDALTRGAVGPPRLATFVWHLPLVAAPDARAPSWWFRRERGGGWLGASVSHFADAANVWFGDIAVVNAVLPMVSERDRDLNAEDSVIIRFRSVAGCEGLIQQSAGIWGEPFQVMRIAGPAGNLVVEDGKVTLATATGTADLDVEPPAVDVLPAQDPRQQFTHLELGPAVRQAQAFRRLIAGAPLGDEPIPPATFADGVAGMRFLDAARRSAAADGATTDVAGARVQVPAE